VAPAREAHQQHALGMLAAESAEISAWSLRYSDESLQLLLGLVDAATSFEGDAV